MSFPFSYDNICLVLLWIKLRVLKDDEKLLLEQVLRSLTLVDYQRIDQSSNKSRPSLCISYALHHTKDVTNVLDNGSSTNKQNE